MDFIMLFVYGCGLVIGLVIMFTILYFVIKSAVKDGIIEAKKAEEKKV